MSGHNPKLPTRAIYDPAGARALLDRFGYKDRNDDGFRELPDGRPLTLKLSSAPSAIERQFDELWMRSMNAIGIRIEFNKQKWPDLLKAGRLGQLQMFQLGNINTTSEGFGFLGLLYGGHAGFSNLARFKQPDYDRLYVQARGMPLRRRARSGDAEDGRSRERVRTVERHRVPLRERARASVGDRLQVQRLQPASVGVLRHRRAARAAPASDERTVLSSPRRRGPSVVGERRGFLRSRNDGV